jgi:transposase
MKNKKYKPFDRIQIEALKKVIKNKVSSKKEVIKAQILLMLDKGVTAKIITETTDYKERQLYHIKKKFYKKGVMSLVDKRLGKPKEILNKRQRNEILKIIKTKKPRDFKYDTDFWTTTILADLIETKYKIKFKSKTSHYLLFKQAKFTFHKPGRVYHKRDEYEVKKWKKITKPIIQKAFEDKDMVILCEDEMVLSTQTTCQKIWLPSGEYPKIEVSNDKKSKSIYGFLNIKTGRDHAFKTNWQNMYITVEVLQKLRLIYPKKKLLILWDGAGWHRGSKVQEFIKEDSKIELLYFPKYSPEEDPQEHVWKEGRKEVSNNKYIVDIDVTTDKFVNYLNTNKFKYSLLGFTAIS